MTAADRPSVTDNARAEAVTTGNPPTTLLACTRCGVLLWDLDAHYRHAHPETTTAADAVLPLLRQAQADAYQRGVDDWADEQGRTVPNPYRQATP